MVKTEKPWYKILNEDEISSPGLLVSPLNIKSNIDEMINISGDVNRLWPHIKTHKMSVIIDLQKKSGISRFKCSTIGELELLSRFNLSHVLLAIQPSTDKLKLFLEIQKNNPQTIFSTLVDNKYSLNIFSSLAEIHGLKLNLWVDINNVMNRTGILSGDKVFPLYKAIHENTHINPLGLHVYDGHIRNPSEQERKVISDAQFKPILKLQKIIETQLGISVKIIAGGSPTFLAHSQRENVFLSPGTTLLWDAGYDSLWPESPFKIAAILATRVISKPNKNLLCLDLGHKSIASEMPLPRAIVLGLEKSNHIGQSEEHLVIETKKANQYEIGDILYAIPYHICPTVIKHNKVQVIEKNKIKEHWEVSARDYLINAF